MISLVEARGFRSLRYVRQQLGQLHVLVGPNASGKTTFLDVPALLAKLVADGLEAAIHERTQNLQDLVWLRSDRSFQLAVEARVPDDRRDMLDNKGFDTIRYEVELGLASGSDEMGILAEKVLLRTSAPPPPAQR